MLIKGGVQALNFTMADRSAFEAVLFNGHEKHYD